MKSNLKIAALFLAFALAAFVCGCQTPAGRSAGEVVDDASITTMVKSKLFGDKVLSGFSISVKTFQGEVTLTGSVLSPGEKERATSVAQSVKGVRSVNNLLTIEQ